MTCIVGVARGGKVYMGGDSCGSSDTWQEVGNPKVFEVENEFLIGGTTSFRMLDLLRFSLTIPDRGISQSDDSYIRTTFIDAVRECFRDNGFLSSDEGHETGGNFLLGYKGVLYEIQTDFSVLNSPPWGMAVGSGEQAARGSLFTTKDTNKVTARIQLALEAAEAVVPSVRGPFYILEL